MVDPSVPAQTIEERSDLGTGDEAVYAYWMAQEASAEKEEKQWAKKGRAIVKRFRDERPEADKSHKFNVLWANVETLKPTLYGRTPKPDVERRFKSSGPGEDPIGRLASDIMERCLSYSVDNCDFDDVCESVVEDRLLPGRGVARVLYVPHYGDEIKEPGKEDDDEENNEKFEDDEAPASTVDNPGDETEKPSKKKATPDREVDYEEVIASYVFWEDYREGAARKWKEVPWVRYRSYLTKAELTKRFGKKKAYQVNLDYTPKSGGSETEKGSGPLDIYKKAIIHEVWDKIKLEAVWYAPGTPDLILDTMDDPLGLPDFFPNPDPLRATSTNDKRIPVADYVEYQDQARELDTLTGRIDRLVQALAVKGVYAGDNKQVLQQLMDSKENMLVPVGDALAWADKGGMKGIIEWFPIQQVAEALIQLYNARDRVKALLYELTGIGDIMRGMTEPDETLGAQELKANFSTRRVTPQQKKVAKFARNLLRLMASVIAEHFQAKTISMITGYPQLSPVPPVPPRPQAPQIMAPLAPQLQLPQQPPVAMQTGAPSGPPAPGAPAAPMNDPPGQPGAPPAAPPNPAMQAYQQQMAQWQQAAQAAQQVQQANQQLQQQFDAAVALIKQDGVHGFRIDIEADSTIAPDEQAEKASRVEFMSKFVPFLEQIVPLSQGNPAAAEMAEQMTLFVMRGFKVARPLEETVTKFFAAMSKMPPPPPKDANKSGVDSPADLALRAKEQTDKDAIERMKLAQQQEQFTETEATKRLQVMNQDKAHHDRLGLDLAHMAKTDALAGARLTHIESRDASSLT